MEGSSIALSTLSELHLTLHAPPAENPCFSVATAFAGQKPVQWVLGVPAAGSVDIGALLAQAPADHPAHEGPFIFIAVVEQRGNNSAVVISRGRLHHWKVPKKIDSPLFGKSAAAAFRALSQHGPNFTATCQGDDMRGSYALSLCSIARDPLVTVGGGLKVRDLAALWISCIAGADALVAIGSTFEIAGARQGGGGPAVAGDATVVADVVPHILLPSSTLQHALQGRSKLHNVARQLTQAATQHLLQPALMNPTAEAVKTHPAYISARRSVKTQVPAGHCVIARSGVATVGGVTLVPVVGRRVCISMRRLVAWVVGVDEVCLQGWLAGHNGGAGGGVADLLQSVVLRMVVVLCDQSSRVMLKGRACVARVRELHFDWDLFEAHVWVTVTSHYVGTRLHTGAKHVKLLDVALGSNSELLLLTSSRGGVASAEGSRMAALPVLGGYEPVEHDTAAST
jgi:hypothetical protein